jgi:hypothetical protein
VYFTSSEFLNEKIPSLQKQKDLLIPPFKSLGIWEDLAYYDYVTEHNPFYQAAIEYDIGKPETIKQIAQDFNSGKVDQSIDHFYRMYHELESPGLCRLIQSALD